MSPASKRDVDFVMRVDTEEAMEEIAVAIKQVAEAVRAIDSSRLTRKAVVLLIQNSVPASGRPPKRPTQTMIEQVLDAAGNLEEFWLKSEEEEP